MCHGSAGYCTPTTVPGQALVSVQRWLVKSLFRQVHGLTCVLQDQFTDFSEVLRSLDMLEQMAQGRTNRAIAYLRHQDRNVREVPSLRE
jgi:hypothetical protein